ncbi:MAG TPA: lytic transglycosylase domain-containing protein [Desulfuromonadales bacterium]|nr:lytic transglycosylase domain-containing protein [Desulfuromonadales bacterium]
MQMLQASISIAGDSPITAPSRAQSSVNSLLQAYLAQQPARGEESSTTPQPQLQPQPQPQPVELAPPPPVSAPKQIHETRNTAWLDPIISKASLKYGVEASLIKAVIKAESNFNPQAVSHAGAQGLMQLMPATARSLGVRDSFDPEQNVMAGTRFLRDMLNRYDNNLESALAAYNWGPGNVDKSPGRLPRETRNYQTRVKEFYSSYTG